MIRAEQWLIHVVFVHPITYLFLTFFPDASLTPPFHLHTTDLSIIHVFSLLFNTCDIYSMPFWNRGVFIWWTFLLQHIESLDFMQSVNMCKYILQGWRGTIRCWDIELKTEEYASSLKSSISLTDVWNQPGSTETDKRGVPVSLQGQASLASCPGLEVCHIIFIFFLLLLG